MPKVFLVPQIRENNEEGISERFRNKNNAAQPTRVTGPQGTTINPLPVTEGLASRLL